MFFVYEAQVGAQIQFFFFTISFLRCLTESVCDPSVGLVRCRDPSVLLLRRVSGSADLSGKLQQVQQQLLSVSKKTSRCIVAHHPQFIVIISSTLFLFFSILFWLCCRDCLALCCLNSATSIFAGIAVFSVLGYMSHTLDLPMEEVASAGGLVSSLVIICMLSFFFPPIFHGYFDKGKTLLGCNCFIFIINLHVKKGGG